MWGSVARFGHVGQTEKARASQIAVEGPVRVTAMNGDYAGLQWRHIASVFHVLDRIDAAQRADAVSAGFARPEGIGTKSAFGSSRLS
jgi:hypothetical protein